MLEMDSPKWKGERDSDGIEDERRKVKEEQERQRGRGEARREETRKGKKSARERAEQQEHQPCAHAAKVKFRARATRRLVKMLLGVSDARTPRLIGD